MMRAMLVPASLLVAITVAGLSPSSASAKGCIKGAIVGGIAGHYAGHHGLLGAAAGCAVGHHMAHKRATTHAQPAQGASGTTTPTQTGDSTH